MDRLEMVRQVVDRILSQQPDVRGRRAGFVHLYSVSGICVLLAVRRGLDPELCAVAGMLHDIWSYKTGDSTDHARLGAPEAQKIVEELGCFSPAEISLVRRAISRHSTKDECDGEVDELLKDADVLQHSLYNPCLALKLGSSHRCRMVFAELGLDRGGRTERNRQAAKQSHTLLGDSACSSPATG